MPAGVYIIHNTANGKAYVGKSVDAPKRMRKHRAELILNRHVNPHLQNAWNKYGPESFAFQMLQVVEDPAQLAALEHHYVQLFRTYQPDRGYNLNDVLPTGSYRASAETRAKQSAAQKARHAAYPWKTTPEQRARMSAAQLARKATASLETRAKMRAAHLGKSQNPEWIAKRIAARVRCLNERANQCLLS